MISLQPYKNRSKNLESPSPHSIHSIPFLFFVCFFEFARIYHAFDCISGEVPGKLMSLLPPGGTVWVYGRLAGKLVSWIKFGAFFCWESLLYPKHTL